MTWLESNVRLEEMKKYNMVVKEMFRSEEDDYKFYNAYTKFEGFSVRKDCVHKLACM